MVFDDILKVFNLNDDSAGTHFLLKRSITRSGNNTLVDMCHLNFYFTNEDTFYEHFPCTILT